MLPFLRVSTDANLVQFHSSLIVAEGTAYATENYMSVKEFLNRGAAIALQVKESGESVWNNEAYIVSHKEVRPNQKAGCHSFIFTPRFVHNYFFRRVHPKLGRGC